MVDYRIILKLTKCLTEGTNNLIFGTLLYTSCIIIHLIDKHGLFYKVKFLKTPFVSFHILIAAILVAKFVFLIQYNPLFCQNS